MSRPPSSLASSMNRPSVAFDPTPSWENGWMCNTPSPWVWMPTGLSNSGMSVFHSPHTFTPNAWWM